MSVASSVANDHSICYRLESQPGQVKLRLWEPVLPSARQPEALAPYLYAANFTFKALGEAESFLRDHLLQNGAFDVPEANFPKEGEIAILPYPTWGCEPS
ncbi:MAG: hypothetical protein ACFBSG_01300 [Leptolyngbyaceae cyanobacterium]